MSLCFQNVDDTFRDQDIGPSFDIASNGSYPRQ